MSVRSGSRSAFSSWAAPLAAVIALAFVAFSCFVVYAYYHEIPYQDSWGLVPQYRELLEGTLKPSTFFITHNEHKITVLRLLALVDYSAAAGTGYFLITLSLLCQAAHALLVGRALGVEGVTGRERLFLTGAAAVILFWLVQSGNFNWSFQVAWFVNALSATAAFYAVSGLRPEAGRPANALRLAVAALGCVLASYGVANGLFICVVLLPLLWKARVHRGYWIAWLAFSAALWSSYFGVQPAARESSPLGAMLRLETLQYVLAYLGNPITRFSLPAGMLLGAAGLAGFAFFGFRYLRSARPSFFEGLVFAELAYVFVTACLTAVGRRDLGLEQASASRYYTTVLIFWLFLCLALWLRHARAGSPGRARFWVRAGAAAAFACVILPIQALSVPQRRERFVMSDEAALALVAGVADTSALRYICVDDPVTWGEGAFLKARGLSIFEEDWAHAPGRALSRFRVDSLFPTLRASLDAPRRVDDAKRPGYFVSGRIEGRDVPEEIFFARGDTIVGVARTVHRRGGTFTGYVRGDDLANVALYEIEDLDDPDEGNGGGTARRIRVDGR